MFRFSEKQIEMMIQFADDIKEKIYTPKTPLNIEGYTTKEPLPFDRKTEGEKKTFKPGDKWGDVFDCCWFHITGDVPEDCKDKHTVLLIDFNGEACVFDNHGNPQRGLTNGSSSFCFSLGQPGKRVLQLSNDAKQTGKIDIWIDAGCNDLFGTLCKDGRIEQADIAVCRDDIRDLYYDYWTIRELMQVLDKDSARYARASRALYEAMVILHNFDEDEVKRARDLLSKELSRKSLDPCLKVSAVGHAHMDLAWLWPIRETFRKAARTFSTVLDLMGRYPEYIFGASQPQLYQWVKDEYPNLYSKIKEKVAEGRWELQGGMWVESDTNLPSGESLIRQFVYGKTFYREEFGLDVRNLWLPDVFGYSASLPQIMKTCGVDYFMTQKLSWNDTNKFPHHTFYWKGLDGTAVLSHMLPEETYNSNAGPQSIAKSEKNYAQKAVSDRCLMLFGIGDGGGGPGAEHLEKLKRLKNLSGLPPVKQEFSSDFFEHLNQDSANYPQWHGELYLEKHRGTYTSQAETKKYNRMLELRLRDLEFLATVAMQNGWDYPQERLDEIWKEVLLYQFHDILPGSSMKRVYDECLERYELLLQEVQQLTRDALKSLSENKNGRFDASSNDIAVFNTLSWKRSEWVQTKYGWLKAEVEPMGFRCFKKSEIIEESFPLKAERKLLENELIRLEFSEDGRLISAYDKQAGFETIHEGSKGNTLDVYTDNGDAWDILEDYQKLPSESFKLESSSASLSGPKAILEQTYSYGNSKLTQKIVLTHGSKRIDFNTEVDWHENSKMLRTKFPLNVFSHFATCDIQFGNLRRPTHTNTSWDKAMLEVCAHKFVDISQKDRGAAILNDCKYGYNLFGNVIDINLLRSTSFPGKEADQGKHSFTYSLLPHKGNLIQGGVAEAASELNSPLIINEDCPIPSASSNSLSFFDIESETAVLETVKKAQEGSEVVLRLYESAGGSSEAKLKSAFEIENAWLTNALEEEICELKSSSKMINLSFRPWEIKTIKLKLE
ncbi:alpha-mannosidase [Sedimentisphaera salicampi]|uniref:Mannosylglycerate hydrolase n=1 Tax=Sedimentisphaera salicampi TaxID=1941349 RepID=A0A1W6LJ66_9BACT|nr:alpha-mannosidase [Sedimentisphaera salicampi]ARN55784.1 Mannosylglycerate hydrolase [Sedimentisphaera salicampi]